MLTFRDLVEGTHAPSPRYQSLRKADEGQPAFQGSGGGHHPHMDLGWGPIPAGKHGGQRKKKGDAWEYRYPDGSGGWTSSRPEGTGDKKDPKKKIKRKPKSLFSRWKDTVRRLFASKETLWVDSVREIALDEQRENGTENDPPLDPEIYKEMEVRERLVMMAEDKEIQASIVRSTNVNDLLSLRKMLLQNGAKEPSPRPKKEDKEDKEEKKTPGLEKKPRVRKKIEDLEKTAQKALNKLLAIVNKRLSQIAPGIIGEVSAQRVRDFLEDLERDKREELAANKDAPMSDERASRVRLGFIVSAKEMDVLREPIHLLERDGDTLHFQDDVGGTFFVNIPELAGTELNKVLDKVQAHPDLDGLRDYTSQEDFELVAPEDGKDPYVPQGEIEKLWQLLRDGVVLDPEQLDMLTTDIQRKLSAEFRGAKREEPEQEDFELVAPEDGKDPYVAQVFEGNEEAAQSQRSPEKPFDFTAPKEKEEVPPPPPGVETPKAPTPKAPTPKAPTPKVGAVEVKTDLLEMQQALASPLRPSLASAIPQEKVRQGAITKLYVSGEFGDIKGIEAQWAVVSAESVVTSHDPITFTQDEKHNVGNERAYHRDKVEQAKVIRQADDLRPDLVVNTNPDATNGAPIIDENGVVLGGNSRAMSMKRVYAGNSSKEGELKAYLKENAAHFGLSAEDVDGISDPILVRQVAGQDAGEKQLLVRQLNENFMQAMDPRTMAVAQARRFNEKTVAAIADEMDPEQTLRSFLDGGKGRAFIKQLERAGIISNSNRNAYINQKTGKLNDNGKSLVENVIVGKALPNADLLSQVSQKVMSSLARSAPYMLQSEAYGGEYSIKEDLEHAVDAIVDIQSRPGGLHPSDSKRRKEALDAWVRTPGLLGEHPAQVRPKAKALLSTLINKPGPLQMSAVFKKYAAAVKQHADDNVTSEGLSFFEKKDASVVFHEVFGVGDDGRVPEKERAERSKEDNPDQTSLI